MHGDNGRFLDWLLAEVKRLNVDVRTGVEATVELLRELAPDAVIVASGARVVTPDIPGVEQSHVLTGALLRQVAAGTLAEEESHRLRRWQLWIVRHVVPGCSAG